MIKLSMSLAKGLQNMLFTELSGTQGTDLRAYAGGVQRNFFSTALVGGACLVALVAGYRFWRKLPPYELGVHGDVVQAETSAAKADAPHVGNCPVFPADNIWNTPVDKLKVDRKSDAYVASIGASKAIHPDFAAVLEYGIPYSEVPNGTRPIPVDFDYKDESDTGLYPIPKDAPIEGKGQGDSHVILIDQQRCILYELFAAHPNGDSWKAGSGIIMDLTSNALRPTGKTSADAAGLAIFPGLVRYEEVASGQINHALRFTLPHTQKAYVWPARHQSGSADTNLPPMGTRFRLRADFDISKFSKSNQVIMTALKKYGMFMADNGSAMFLSGVPDKRWDDSDLHKLNAMTAADFEVVDESDLQLLPDSGRVDPVALKRY